MATIDRLLFGLLACLFVGFAWLCVTSFTTSMSPATTHSMSPATPQNSDVEFDKLICENAIFDFGVIRNDRELIHQFIVKNTSEETYEIVDVVSSCGCMVPRTQLKGKTVNSGGELSIPVLVDSTGKSGDFVGRLQISYKSKSSIADGGNDRETLVLSLKGEVQPVLTAVPSEISVAELIDNEVLAIQINRTDGGSFDNVNIEAPGNLVDFKLTEKTGSQLQLRVRATSLARSPNPTVANGGISIHIPDIIGNSAYLYIPVQGLLTGNSFRCTPQRLVLNRIRKSQPLSLTGLQRNADVVSI